MSRQCVSKYTYFHVFHLGCFFSQVIQWATYHKDDPPATEEDENKEKRTDDISSWDADFLKVDQVRKIKNQILLPIEFVFEDYSGDKSSALLSQIAFFSPKWPPNWHHGVN